MPRRRRTRITAVVLVGMLTALLAACGSSDTKAKSPKKPTLTQAQGAFFGDAFAPISHGSFGLDRMAVGASGSDDLPSAVTVTYPKDSASTRSSEDDSTPHGGSQLYLPLSSGSVDELHLRYYMKLPAGFTWVKGGKLPGLYGGTVNNGRRIPDGSDGWSTRYMWRRDGAAEVYAYLPSSQEHGTSLGRGDWVWPTGSWTSVEQAVKLNTPGKNDGSVTVWLNGKQVYSKTDITFRTTEDLQIDGLFFSTFFGGGDSTWATPREQSAQFAAFAVSPSYIGPLPATSG